MTKSLANKFKMAVEATPDIDKCYKPGLNALGVHSSKIVLSEGIICNGSVNIDACLKEKYPDSNRWDYCFGCNHEVFFIEVHPANISDIKVMINKMRWLKDWLKNQAPQLDSLKATSVPAFYWIQSGRNAILPNSPQARRMAKEGIKPIGKLKL